MKWIVLCILWLCPGCAPMPGNVLFNGLARETRLEEIADFRVIIDPLMTTIECNKLLYKYGQYGIIALNVVGMGGFILACADLHGDQETGLIDRCIIYSSFDWDILIEHEKRHCLGYQDLLY